MTYYIGIDNGKKGGLCVIDEHSNVVFKAVLPVIGKDYDVHTVVKYLRQYKPEMVILEKTLVMGGKTSKVGAMSSGMCLGIMQGVCAALDYPFVIVSPKVWQRSVFKGMSYSDTKTASINFAKRMQPKEDWRPSERCKNLSDGMTDAYAMAIYGKMTYGS